MGNPNFEIWKEPRGFLKCLQVFLAVFAFSCATGFRGSFSFNQNCKSGQSDKSHKIAVSYKYPFNEDLVFQMMKNCSDDYVTITKPMSERSSTEFFVVIGVFCFLFSLAMLIYYIYFEDVDSKIQAKTAGGPVNYTSGPVVDFSLAVFFAFFWFVGSIAQAAAVSGIKDYSNLDEIIGSLDQCKPPNECVDKVISKYATLTVSILLGFLNTFVWCGNTWFLWKETPWHKEPHHTTPVQAAPHQQMPPAAI